MEIFGIGPLELLFVLVIALVVLGPRDMVKAGRSLGRFLRRTILSPNWLKMQREIRNLPYQMMREAGLEEEDLRIKADLKDAYRGKSTHASAMSAEDKRPDSIQIQTNQAEDPLPSVPPEWLGFPTPSIASSGIKPTIGDPPPLPDWTTAPIMETPTREQHDDKDGN